MSHKYTHIYTCISILPINILTCVWENQCISKRNTNGFIFGNSLEQVYIDGISLTHGAPGSRRHIWTFVAAIFESNSGGSTGFKCPCIDASFSWPHTVPSFIGNNYFCDTGDHDEGFVYGMYYPDDPLFDGEGCGPDSTCCQFNTPPWFCTALATTTSQ